MKKVLAVLVLAIMTTGCAQAQNRGYNRGYANPGYNNSYRVNNGYNYAGAAIVGAVVGAVAAGVISQSYAQPVAQLVCWQEPATTYVPSQLNPNQMVPITTVRTVCR
jgi:hypothetical protein